MAVDKPSAAQIAIAQDTAPNLKCQLAARSTYKKAKRFHFAGTSLAIAFALGAPVVLLFKPDLGPLLGALAGLWIFVARLVLEPVCQKLQLKGARIQETFDCAVLGLEWNDALVRQVPREEIRAAARNDKVDSGLKAWYPTPDNCNWPMSVLVCQRANIVWARRQHHAYAVVLIVGASSWFVFGIVVALLKSAPLAQYLTTIALPSLPALLDASETARRHLNAAQNRERLEDRVDKLCSGPAAVSATDLRELQDQLFDLRATAPIIPEWFYRLIKRRYEADMQYAATGLAEDHSDGD